MPVAEMRTYVEEARTRSMVSAHAATEREPCRAQVLCRGALRTQRQDQSGDQHWSGGRGRGLYSDVAKGVTQKRAPRHRVMGK